jgi:hypothetical protein
VILQQAAGLTARRLAIMSQPKRTYSKVHKRAASPLWLAVIESVEVYIDRRLEDEEKSKLARLVKEFQAVKRKPDEDKDSPS